MPVLQMFKKAAICLALALACFACTFTTTKIKNPEFATPIDSLQTVLNGLVVCEHINLDGKEITTNGKPSGQLEIDILNPKNIPDDKARIKTMLHSIAEDVKAALKDKNEYDKYVVLFVKVDTSGAVTNKSWSGYTFKSVEL